jgi:hypothetical protein
VPKNNAVKERVEELIDLTEEEAATLKGELREIVKSNRRPFSRRIVALRAILARLRPTPAHLTLPPLKLDEPPARGRYRQGG